VAKHLIARWRLVDHPRSMEHNQANQHHVTQFFDPGKVRRERNPDE
jgi:hypothetical protein